MVLGPWTQSGCFSHSLQEGPTVALVIEEYLYCTTVIFIQHLRILQMKVE